MPKKLTSDDKKHVKNLKYWVKEREKDLRYSIQQFDKLITVLSSGSLLLSIGFVRDIVKITSQTNTCLLKASWYLFTTSLIIILLSQISTYKANRIEINISNDEIYQYRKHGKYNDSFNKKNKRKVLIYNTLTIIFNITALLSLIVGILLFVVFVNQNI